MNELARRPTGTPTSSVPALLQGSFCCRSEVVVPELPWPGWPSASHSGQCVCLAPPRLPWPFLLQLPSWTWFCACLSCISCLPPLLLPHGPSDPRGLQTPSLIQTHCRPWPVRPCRSTLTIQSQDTGACALCCECARFVFEQELASMSHKGPESKYLRLSSIYRYVDRWMDR